MLALVAGGRDDLKVMRGVCKSWQAGFEASATSIRVSYSGPLLPPTFSLQERFPALTSLDLGASRMPAANLGALQGLARLRILNLGLSHWQSYRLVYSDTLAKSLRGAGLGFLRGLPITHLILDRCSRLTDVGLQHLGGFPLQSLSLFECTSITNEGMSHLRNLSLTSLDISKCYGIWSSGLRCLSGMPLTNLKMGGLKEGLETTLAVVRSLPLISLDLTSCYFDEMFWDMRIGHLRGMLRLQNLNLGRVDGLDDLDLVHLAGLPLTSLSLGWCPEVTGAGFAALGGMPLKYLDLSASGISDFGLANLHGFPLTHLWLSYSGGWSNAGLANLRGMPLEALDIKGCWHLSSKGLWELQGLPLTSLTVSKSGRWKLWPGLAALRRNVAPVPVSTTQTLLAPLHCHLRQVLH